MQKTTQTTGGDTAMEDVHVWRSVGCLLGEHHGSVVKIMTCFDMALVPDPAGETSFSSIDWDVLRRKVELYREMEPSIDVMGWYVTAVDISEEDVWLHKKFLGLNPASVLLVFNPQDEDTAHALQVYESEECMVDGQKQIRFTKGMHEIVSTEVERIVVNQFSDLTVSDDVNRISNCLEAHQTDLHRAVVTLIERVVLLQQILIEMRNGTRPYNREVITAIAAFIHRLPLSKNGASCHNVSRIVDKQKDSLLTTLIAATMSGLSSLEEHAGLETMSSHHTAVAVTPDRSHHVS